MRVKNFIPQANPGLSYHSHKFAIDEAIQQVLASGYYIQGEQCKAFESEFASWLGIAEAVGVGNGTDALEVALRTLGIGFGDEVITVSHSAVATVAAIELVGAIPVLVDINPETFTIDPLLIENAVGPRSKAIIPVHIYGMAADMEPILEIARRHDLRVIEDCAQAHGATYRGQPVGTFGDMAEFSFYPTKNLGALGDGGAIASNNQALAATSRRLSQYGWRERYVSEQVGMNTRLDELQAAILRVKLTYLDSDNARRVKIAQQYTTALADAVSVPKLAIDRQSVFHLYVIRHQERDRLRKHLAECGVGTAIHYPVPIHLQPAYRDRLAQAGSLPQTERAAQEILSLPMYPELTDEDVNTVIEAIRSF